MKDLLMYILDRLQVHPSKEPLRDVEYNDIIRRCDIM